MTNGRGVRSQGLKEGRGRRILHSAKMREPNENFRCHPAGGRNRPESASLPRRPISDSREFRVSSHVNRSFRRILIP